MLATSYHNVNMPKRQTSFNPEWTKEHECISKRDFAHCVYLWSVYLFIFRIHYLFIYVFLLLPEVQKFCFLALCQIICLCMYLFYFQKSRNFVFWHCARLFVYLCIYFIFRSPEMLCFLALCTLQDRFISMVSFWNRHHDVLNKYKYCEQTLFCLFCYT